MKMNTLKKAIPAAVLLASAAGLSSNANAAVYAVAYNNIYDLNVFSNPFVSLADFTAFSVNSAAAANLNGDGASGSQTNGGPADAPIKIAPLSVFAGGNPTNNAMTVKGQAGNYSYADSQVSQTALLDNGTVTATGNLTQAWGIAENYINGAGNADATTSNASETGFNSTISLQQDTAFSFSFKAAPYMFVEMSADAVGISSNAEITVTLTITDVNNNTVFQWSPDGQVNDIIGGTETSDEYNLNLSREVSAAGTSSLYNPTGGAAPDGTINPAAFGTFAATSNLLAAGVYTISLDMVEKTNLSSRGTIPPPPPPVPAPGVLGLMGLALAGLGFSRRRKAAR